MGSSGVNFAVLGQYGVLGLVATVLIYFAYEQIKREQARSDAAEAQVVELNKALRDYAVSVTTAIEAIRDLAETHRALIQLLRDVQSSLDRSDRG